MLIYVDEISERLIYTFDFVFNSHGLNYKLTNDPLFFEKSDESKINYSNRFFENQLSFNPSDLLFDEKIIPYSISKGTFEEVDCLAFDKIVDPLASIFYVLSRMEEYIDQKRDKHKRFEAKQSVLYRYDWLQKCICDRWSIAFISFLNRELKLELITKKQNTKIIPTFDIDTTFAFQWKSSFRNYLSQLRDKLKNDKSRIIARKMFYASASNDPYDTFEYIEEISKRGFETYLFWLLGSYGKYDKNISSNDSRHQNLIKKMSKVSTIGLHPSYKSNSSIFYLNKEKQKLSEILKKKITISRQHFLKLEIPTTYSNLIQNGFTDDFSLGFADEVGFRAGTAKSISFFDLTTNSKTNFILHPFAYMDGTLNEYKKYSIEESKEIILKLYQEVELYGGNFIFIWHNHTIGNFSHWEGWKEVLEFTLNLQKIKQ
jgi:hypothetical protein